MSSSLNGIDVSQLSATIDAIKNNPTMADFKFNATTTWLKGGHCSTKIQNFTGANTEDKSRNKPFILDGDEPPLLLGENHGPNAVEALLHALGSCLSVGVVYNAAARGININSLSFDIEGELNLHAFLGLSETIRPGYSGVKVKINIDTDASPDSIEDLCRYVEKTSPVLDCIRNPVPITLTVATKETI
jgi:uncharacterized OsmC-like protein